MKDTSDLLKRTRLSKNLTLEEISSQTKIQLHILKALDEGNIDSLPNKVFIKGFLRQYAQALGLKPSEIMEIFDRENSTSTPQPTKAAPISRMDNNQMQEKTNVLWFRAPAKLISVVGVVIIVALIGAIYFFMAKYAAYSQETVTNSVNVSQEPPSPADTPQLETLINKKEESLALPKPAAPESSTPAQDAGPADDIKPKIVSIEAQDMVTIEASWSTGKKEVVKLRANSRHVFYYAKKIKLIVSDGGQVKVTANDKELEQGEKGKPVTLNFE
jgi:cytoskeleton protein RodZ